MLAALSPAGRFYATDMMLEALGAGLTMLALAFHAAAVEDRECIWKWRGMAITLTLLFFEKYNYWILAVASIAVWHSGSFLAATRGWLRAIDWKKTDFAQVREPLNWALFLAVAAVLLLFWRGDVPVHLFGRAISIYPPDTNITIAYALFFLRVAVMIRRLEWKPRHAWDTMLWRWHVLPLAVSFLVPKRLGEFFSYQNPFVHNPVYFHPFPQRVPYYWNGFVTDYCPAPWIALLAVALACIAVCQLKTLNAGGRTVITCVLIAGTLTILHANNQARFLHTWVPALSTSAGIGAAVLLGKIPAPLRAMTASLAVALLAAAGGYAAWTSPPLRASTVSDLDYSDAWLPELAGSRLVAFVATQPCWSFVSWTFKEKYGGAGEYERPDWQFQNSPKKLRAAFNTWLAGTSDDALVIFCITPESPSYSPGLDEPLLPQNVEDLMASQTRFQLAKRIDFKSRGCTVEVWRLAAK